MLTNIVLTPAAVRSENARPPQKAEADGAIAMLIGCHERIRHFTGIALRIAWTPGAPLAELSDAAASVLRYYHKALPLHEADENESLYLRLRNSAASPAVLAANDAMLQQHAELDDVIATLLPLWDSVQRDPSSLEGFAPVLLARTERLHELWQAHLRMEEEIVFPALRTCLSAAEFTEITAEIRARHEPT